MSTGKKKVRKKKSVTQSATNSTRNTIPSNDDETHEYTMAAPRIHTDHVRSQGKVIDSLPVWDVHSEHFDERKIDKNEYFRQSVDWVDCDTSTALQHKYAIGISAEFEQHSVDVAPFEAPTQSTQYARGAYTVNDDVRDAIDTDLPRLQHPANPAQQRLSSSDHSDAGDDDDEELRDKHPSEGGDARKYIHSQIKEANANYEAWKSSVSPTDEEPEAIWNSCFAAKYEDKDNWWNRSAKQRYDMPHQALHGGCDQMDDESDIPLNAYWHKSTVSPDSWHMIKTKFRENMRPGSQEWNKWAYRCPSERQSLKYWPRMMQIWFLRSEEELIHSHDFRCKMLELSALDEYWRIGELRWNRALWEPYIRIGTWVVAPLLGGFLAWWYRRAVGWRTREQFNHEYKRWKKTVAVDEGDEHYMFTWKDSLQKRRPPPVVSPAMSVEDVGSVKKRSLSYHAERLLRGKPNDPY